MTTTARPPADVSQLTGPPRTLLQRAFFWFCWSVCLAVLSILFRARRFGMHNIPARGPVLLAANHQSHLDPPLVGVCCTKRPMHFLARAGLFKNPIFGWLISAVNAVPIREEAGDLAAIRQILDRLSEGAPVLVFPEGSRTYDGAQQPFKRGIALLLKRAKCPVIPVAVEGCYDAFPRWSKRPRFARARVAVMIGEPISPEDLLAQGPEAALERLAREIERMRLELRSKLRAASAGRTPPPGLGDRSIWDQPARTIDPA
jgi:1-acyl-sn-glycerol-3-phosphate acyltransferase